MGIILSDGIYCDNCAEDIEENGCVCPECNQELCIECLDIHDCVG